MKTPPQGFVRSIEALDSLLRVRWGSCLGEWVIDRTAYLSNGEREFLEGRVRRNAMKARLQEKVPNDWKATVEEMLSAREGRRVILYTPTLDSKVFDNLVAADMQRYGGYARFCDEIEQKEQRQREAFERKMADMRRGVNEESWSQIRFLLNKRQAAWDAGQRNLKQLLHG